MSEPLQPWRDGGPADEDTRRAAELVSQASAIHPRPVELSSGWEAVLERATRRRPSALMLLAVGVAAALVGVVATAAVLRSRAPRVVAVAGTRWAPERDGVVQLQRGKVQTVRRVSLRLESPQVSIVARECSFAAEVITEGTRVTVFEGEAVVRSGEGVERTLVAGESALWPATPVLASSLTPSVPPASDPACAEPGCLEAAAAGDDLRAEVALVELARQQPERAVAVLSDSLRRFPDGVFVPEVRLGLMAALVKQQRFAEALEVTRAFEAAEPDDPRVEDVRALRRQLEWLVRAR